MKIFPKIIRSALPLTAAALLSACIEINSSGYSDLSETEKQHVRACTVPLDSVTNDGNLYKVTVGQVRDYIRRNKEVIVYEWLPFCSGSNGRPPMEVKRACDRRHIPLVVISSVYDGVFPIPATNAFPLFVIDNAAYNTDNYQTYGEAFYKALTGSDSEERQVNSFHYFHDGRYVRSFEGV